MGWEAWLTTVVVLGMFASLARYKAPSDFVLWVSLGLLILAGMVSGTTNLPNIESAVRNFGNPGLVTIGFLFIVIEGLSRTGATRYLSEPLLRLRNQPTGMRSTLLGSVSAASAFLNNTAIVAMFLPVTRELCRRSGVSPSQLFMPMCFAATLGGVCTLIGTSTNLVVDGMMQQRGLAGLGIFEISWVGVPVAIAGLVYLIYAPKWLLPNRSAEASIDGNPREYVVEMRVEENGQLDGKSVESAGLRRLPGLFLVEIEREGEILAAVSGHQQLKGGDRLVLFGAVESVPDLRRIDGLIPVMDSHYDFESRRGRWLTEVVVSPDCPVLGRSIRESDFRGHYSAAVLAVGRGGKRIRGKAGDVILRAGDALLLESQDDFASGNKSNRDFYLVTPVPGFAQTNTRLATLAIVIVFGMLLAVGTGLADLLPASMVAAIAMVACRCCTAVEARQSIEWSVLLTIAAAFGIANSLELSGAATAAASTIVQLAGERPWALLLAVYVATLLATELITNNAAAALMFPIAMQIADGAGLKAVPFAIAVMIAASCGFATPFGYQTNLMVAGPGGYRFMDYVRFGVFLDLLAMAIAIVLIPFFWPLAP